MSAEKFEHGTMDVTVQEKTFEGFIKMVARVAILCIVVLIFIGLANG